MPLGLEDSSWGNPLRRARHRSRTEAPHLSCPISSQTASQIRLQRSDHSRQQGASIRLASATLEEVILDGVEPKLLIYRAQSLAKQLRKFGYNVQITPANRAPA